jgi:hypothetical protein
MSRKILEGEPEELDDIKPEYDLSALPPADEQQARYRAFAAAHTVRLAPDVMEIFKDEEVINEILRSVIAILEASGRIDKRDKAA